MEIAKSAKWTTAGPSLSEDEEQPALDQFEPIRKIGKGIGIITIQEALVLSLRLDTN